MSTGIRPSENCSNLWSTCSNSPSGTGGSIGPNFPRKASRSGCAGGGGKVTGAGEGGGEGGRTGEGGDGGAGEEGAISCTGRISPGSDGVGVSGRLNNFLKTFMAVTSGSSGIWVKKRPGDRRHLLSSMPPGRPGDRCPGNARQIYSLARSWKLLILE